MALISFRHILELSIVASVAYLLYINLDGEPSHAYDQAHGLALAIAC